MRAWAAGRWLALVARPIGSALREQGWCEPAGTVHLMGGGGTYGPRLANPKGLQGKTLQRGGPRGGAVDDVERPLKADRGIRGAEPTATRYGMSSLGRSTRRRRPAAVAAPPPP